MQTKERELVQLNIKINLDPSFFLIQDKILLPEGGMFIENFSIEMDADVGLHIFRAVVENFVRVQTLRHRPRADNIIHDALAESFRHFVELHKFSHVVQHVVILSSGRCHLLDDCGDMTEDCGVQ